MCGLAGLLDPRAGLPADRLTLEARAMGAAIRHRGPDDAGVWVDPAAGLALAHQRLSILDLSPEGHQPMRSADGRLTVVFNGEIYNFAALKSELEAGGARFRGRSDTEVLLEAIAAWGCRRALEKAVGMFAFAVWDAGRRRLTLARDRLGEKPLYYGWSGRVFLFGSELKALEAYSRFDGAVDRGAVAALLRYNCVPGPYSIYRGVRKLPPGSMVELDAGWAAPERAIEPVTYWSARDAAEKAWRAGHSARGLSDDDAVRELDRLLSGVVARQMVSDVPLGAFLSGGIDSSTIVALMQAQSPRPVRTFSIGFREPGYDEAGAARAVAGELGTEHTELYVTAREALAVVPELASLYDEPFADSSQIPTVLLARLARQGVTVSLSGDGGDEVFGGYNRYVWAPRLWRRLSRVPGPARRAAHRAVAGLSDGALRAALGALGPLKPRANLPVSKLRKVIDALGSRSLEDVYLALRSHWPDPAEVVLGADEPATPPVRPAEWPRAGAAAMLAVDAMTYLPDDILVKVDRAAMAVGLETRVPFLDPEVVAFAWALKPDQRIRDGRGKWALRELLRRRLPAELMTVVERPKAGFAAPVGEWLRGELRDWAEGLLAEKALREGGIFDPRPVRAAWLEHSSGRRNREAELWDVLAFQAWAARPRRPGS